MSSSQHPAFQKASFEQWSTKQGSLLPKTSYIPGVPFSSLKKLCSPNSGESTKIPGWIFAIILNSVCKYLLNINNTSVLKWQWQITSQWVNVGLPRCCRKQGSPEGKVAGEVGGEEKGEASCSFLTSDPLASQHFRNYKVLAFLVAYRLQRGHGTCIS